MQTYLSTTQRCIGRVYVSHSIAAIWLLQILVQNAAPSVEASSFDHFKKSMPLWMKDRENVETMQAELACKHPLRPDPLPALRLLQKHVKLHYSEWLMKRYDPAGKDSSARGWLFFVQTAQLLAKSGSYDDAKWVLDLGRDSLPLRFSMDCFRGGSSKTTNRRLATSYEVALGMADVNGYLLPSKERTLLYTTDPTKALRMLTTCVHRTRRLPTSE